MRLLTIITLIAIFALPANAGMDTSCHEDCFLSKQKCNTGKSHTFNSCDNDLFSCKASCASGKKQEVYNAKLPIDISFQPVLDLED